MTFSKAKVAMSVLVVSFLVSGCGSGVEPLNAIGDPTRVPEIAMPLASGNFNPGLITPFSAGNDGFSIISTALNAPVLAPISGFVTGVDISTGTVTIYATPRFSARVVNVQNAGAIRLGDYVTAGQSSLGTATIGTTVRFSVILDGAAVCPYSYLSTDTRTSINTMLQNTVQRPCI